jgi:drug/metabolite transporter (DMT)-like permease
VSILAISLVLVAAFTHAGWNLLSKQVSHVGGVGWVWLVAACAGVIFAPFAVIAAVVTHQRFTWPVVAFMVGTAALHSVYTILLQRGYRVGDLSLVYPLARGTGPLVSSLVAIWLFAERPGVTGVIAIVLVAIGIFILGLPTRTGDAAPSGTSGTRRAAVGYGLATGLAIAAYTLWDKHAVTALAINPLLYDWGSNFGRAILLAPAAMRNRDEIALLWRRYRSRVIATAVLMSLAYILVLFALSFSPVSSIAPAREISVLIGVVLGGRLLAEGDLPRRLIGAAAVAAGVAAIALG